MKYEEPVLIAATNPPCHVLILLPGMFDFKCLSLDNLCSIQNKYLILISRLYNLEVEFGRLK